MVAQWSVDPSLRPGRYLYIQKVRSVSTWRCDSLPKWDVVQHPISFLTPSSDLSNPHWNSSNSARETHRKLRSKARMDVLTQNVPANQGESQNKDAPLLISESGVFCLDSWLFSS